MNVPVRTQLDEPLIERIRMGDLAAFEELFRTYYEQLVDFARSHVGSQDVAEDVVQVVFCNVWGLRKQWRPRASVRAYLYGAVRNRCLDYLETERNHERLFLEHGEHTENEADPARQLEAKELRWAIDRSVAELPERRRQIFVLARDHGLSYAEIAALLGISIHTVDVQLVRATRFLRGRLANLLSTGD